MNHEFCIQCGNKNIYQIAKPKFCAGCGQPFNTTLVSKSSRQESDQEDEEEYVSGKFDIEKLRKTVAAQVEGSKISLDDLWKDPQQSSYSPRQASSDPEGNTLLKQIMNECKGAKEPVEINV